MVGLTAIRMGQSPYHQHAVKPKETSRWVAQGARFLGTPPPVFVPQGRIKPDRLYRPIDGGLFKAVVTPEECQRMMDFMDRFCDRFGNTFSTPFQGQVTVVRQPSGRYALDMDTFYWKWGSTWAEGQAQKQHRKALKEYRQQVQAFESGAPNAPTTKPVRPGYVAAAPPDFDALDSFKTDLMDLKPVVVTWLQRYVDMIATQCVLNGDQDSLLGESFQLRFKPVGLYPSNAQNGGGGVGFHSDGQDFIGLYSLNRPDQILGGMWLTRWQEKDSVPQALRNVIARWQPAGQGDLGIFYDLEQQHAVMPWLLNDATPSVSRRDMFQILQGRNRKYFKGFLNSARSYGGIRNLERIVIEGPTNPDTMS